MIDETEACCKVGAAIAAYDLDARTSKYESFDDWLVARWKGDEIGTAQGYRPLTEWFNKQLLKREYDRRSLQVAGTRVDRDHAALTGDDDLRSGEIRDVLRSEEVDVESLERSFVSWSTMQRHLTDCLGERKEPQEAQTDWERNSVEFAREKLESKIDDALHSLSSKDELRNADQANVSVRIELGCPDCPLRVPLEEALDRGYICKDHLGED